MSADIHIAITRRVRPGHLADFERLLADFSSRSLAEPGARGMHWIHPPPGSSSTEYGILHSFANAEERDAFYHPFLAAGVISAGIVIVLTWAAMPLLVKITHPWLQTRNPNTKNPEFHES